MNTLAPPGSVGPVALALAAVLGLVHAGTALAQAPSLDPKSVTEFVDPDERISGNAVVGLAYLGEADGVGTGVLYAFLDAPPKGELTLQFNGIDGRYRLEAKYDSPPSGAGPVPLNLGALSHRNLLVGYDTGRGAVLLSDSDGRRFPVRWGSGERPASIRVYVNAERAEAFFFRQDPAGRQLVLCQTPPSVTPPFKFNRVCDVPAAQFAAGPVQIQRRLGSRRLEPIVVDIARAAAD